MGVETAKQIVLLGPDCSGKSTLSKMLAYHYGLEVLPNRRIKDDLSAVVNVINFVQNFINDPQSGFILDQWQYPVDIVYNRTLRGCDSVMSKVQEIILPYLKNVIFIHVDASDEVLRKRYAERGDELWDDDQIVRVANAYRVYFASGPLQVYRIDTTYKEPAGMLAMAIAIVEKFYNERGKQDDRSSN